MIKHMKESEAEALARHWKNVAKRYRRQRDIAVRVMKKQQQVLLQSNGRALDGYDYLRDIMESGTKAPWRIRLMNLCRVLQGGHP